MAKLPAVINDIPNSGVRGVVFASQHPALASAYAKLIGRGFAYHTDNGFFVGVRCVQPAGNSAEALDRSDLNALNAIIEFLKPENRDTRKRPKDVVVYIERFDYLPTDVIESLASLRMLGIDLMVVGAVDVATKPNRKSLEIFDFVRVVNVALEERNLGFADIRIRDV